MEVNRRRIWYRRIIGYYKIGSKKVVWWEPPRELWKGEERTAKKKTREKDATTEKGYIRQKEIRCGIKFSIRSTMLPRRFLYCAIPRIRKNIH